MKVMKRLDDIGISSLAEEYEILRTQEQVIDIERIKTSFFLQAEILAFVNAMSEFYKQPKVDVYNDLLESAVTQFFFSLPESTRDALSKRADRILETELKAAYEAVGGSVESVGSYWQSLAHSLRKEV